MEVKKCLNCGKEVEQKEGRRERLYCNQSCKGLYFRKSKPKEKRYVQADTYKRLVEENLELKRKLSESGSILRGTVYATDLPKEFDMEKAVEIKHDEPPQYEVPELPNAERIAKIEQMLKAPPKYLPHNKRVILEKELSELKFKIN